jgi:flagellar motor switch protein FliM
VTYLSSEAVKYGDFINMFPYPTSLNIFEMKPLIGSALLAVEANLVFALVDCMFGGAGQPLKEIREFTLIEQHVIRKLVLEILSRLEKAWSDVHPVGIQFKKMHSKPEFVRLAGPNESMINVAFTVKSDSFSGNLHLCFSYLMLEPIRDKLCSIYRCGNAAQQAWSDQLLQLLGSTPVMLVAELGKTQRTIREVLNLKVNDVLRLQTGPKDFVTLAIDGVPKFYSFPGVVKGSRAVEIVKWIK